MNSLKRSLDIVKVVSGNTKYYSTLNSTSKLKSYLNESFDPIYIKGDSRGREVYQIPEIGVIVKKNRLHGFKRRALAYFSMQNKFGRFSLIDEYKNLMFLSEVSYVPKVYAYGYNSKGLIRDEVIVLELFSGAITLDSYLENNLNELDKVTGIISRVFILFSKAWKDKFAHMDPNPSNILIYNNSLRFIDLECCSLSLDDKEFYFGFSMGYLYHFWINKYIDECCYDKLVFKFFDLYVENLNIKLFLKYYNKFKSEKVSRKARYSAFSCDKYRKLLIE